LCRMVTTKGFIITEMLALILSITTHLTVYQNVNFFKQRGNQLL